MAYWLRKCACCFAWQIAPVKSLPSVTRCVAITYITVIACGELGLWSPSSKEEMPTQADLVQFGDRQFLCVDRVERIVAEALQRVMDIQAKAAAPYESPWMHGKDVQKHLGISSATLSRLKIASDPIPFHRVGGLILYHRDEVDDFITKCKS